jgi:hypothetical protein
MKRAIEEGFPIVEINRLAVPERNAFKPIGTELLLKAIYLKHGFSINVPDGRQPGAPRLPFAPSKAANYTISPDRTYM